MKVTRWTDFENDQYEDILLSRSAIVGKIINKYPKIPTYKEIKESGIQIEELNRQLDERRRCIDEDMKNSAELKDIEALIEEVVSCVKQDIIANNYHFTGSTHQNYDFGCPVIDDKYVYRIGQRAWGGLMYECYPEEDYEQYKDGAEYVKWAWIAEEKEIIPKGEGR